MMSLPIFLALSGAGSPPEAAGIVTALSRYAVKGLSSSPLTSVEIAKGETFPDDRRFALLKRVHADKFDGDRPEWVHKENFLCAFSAPDLMAGFESEYRIMGGVGGEESRGLPWDDDNVVGDRGGDAEGAPRRMLTVWRRDPTTPVPPALGPIDLSAETGRVALGEFFSAESGEGVVCVTAASAKKHTHQFGNTRSGVRERGDTRTIHLVNAATVRELSDRIGVKLSPSRFRPNVVVDGLEPWKEFDFVGKTLCVRQKGGDANGGGMKIDVIARTVRCEGIGIDPDDPGAGLLDMPKLLKHNFPQHGPYFGVYATIAEGGRLGLGDKLIVLEDII